MTIKLASLKVDLEREKAGDWIAYPEWPGVEFNVSSLTVPEFVNAQDAMQKRLRKAYKGVRIPPQILQPELGKLLARHVLHDWKGIDEAYSPEKAREILSDYAYRDVVDAVLYCASLIGQSDAEFLEDEGKKSAPSSDGGSKAQARQTG